MSFEGHSMEIVLRWCRWYVSAGTSPTAEHQRLRVGAALAPATLALVALAYGAAVLSGPPGSFWSSDQGGKLLQTLALLEGRYDLSISYPGRWLDPELAFRPYMNAYVVGDAIQMPW